MQLHFKQALLEWQTYQEKDILPKWLVANWSSMLSLDKWKGVAMIPALLLQNKLNKITCSISKSKRINSDSCLLKYMRQVTMWQVILQLIRFPHMRTLRGRPEELYFDANFSTDANELRSNSITSILAVGISSSISFLTCLPASTFLTAMTTWAPHLARVRAVSTPMPLDAPRNHTSPEI